MATQSPPQQQEKVVYMKEMFEDRDGLATEEKRLAKAIEQTSKGTWEEPVEVPRPSYRAEMTGKEEMDMLRARRKELEEKMRREGKLK